MKGSHCTLIQTMINNINSNPIKIGGEESERSEFIEFYRDR